MVEGVDPHVRPQDSQEGYVGRAGDRGKTWAQGEGEIMVGLRRRGSSCVWHHGGLKHRRT